MPGERFGPYLKATRRAYRWIEMAVLYLPLEAIAGDLEWLAATFLDFIKIASCFGSND